MASEKPLALLMTAPVGRIREALGVHCRIELWREVTDRDAFLANEGPSVRILVTAGGVPIRDTLLDHLPNLGLIAFFSSGYEGVNLSEARRRGIELSHAPNTNHEDVADIAIGLTIATVRRLSEADAIIRSGDWTRPLPIRMTPSLRQLRYGIVGLGAVGQAIAERLEAFGGKIAWWGPRPKPQVRWPRARTLLDLARESDVLILALRADETNRGIIDAAVLEAIGPHGYLVNVARGLVVDEDALVDALRSGRLAGAGLDVYAKEPTDPERWRDLPSVALAPHVGGWAEGSFRETERLLGENVRLHLAGEPLLTPVPE